MRYSARLASRVLGVRLDQRVPRLDRLPDQVRVLEALPRVPQPLGVLAVLGQRVGGGQERTAALLVVAALARGRALRRRSRR